MSTSSKPRFYETFDEYLYSSDSTYVKWILMPANAAYLKAQRENFETHRKLMDIADSGCCRCLPCCCKKHRYEQ